MYNVYRAAEKDKEKVELQRKRIENDSEERRQGKLENRE